MSSSDAINKPDLHWALRGSFRDYVEAIDDGRVDRKGVDLDAEDRFVFTRSAKSSDKVWIFDGRVDFWAHFGVLDFRLYDVHLAFFPQPHVSVGPQIRETERVVLADLTELPSEIPGARMFSAALTGDGVRALGGVYAVGDVLDPLTLVTGS